MVSRHLSNSSPPTIHPRDPFYGVLRPSIITIASGDIGADGRFFCWWLRISKLRFDVPFEMGLLYTQADGLSRLRPLWETTSQLTRTFSPISFTPTWNLLNVTVWTSSTPTWCWPPIPLHHSSLLLLTRIACHNILATSLAQYVLVLASEEGFLCA